MQEDAAVQLRLKLLGPYSLTWSDGTAVLLSGGKVKALLAILAVNSRKTWQRESLMALLWPDAPQQDGQASLRQTIYRLRQAIPEPDMGTAPALPAPLLLTSRSTVQINPAAQLEVDIASFYDLLAEVKTHRHSNLYECPSCLDSLETAVAHYDGDFLADLYLRDSSEFEQWAGSIRAAARRDTLEALEEVSNAHFDAGRLDQAERFARRQLALDPLHESAQRQLMLVLARSGKKVEALAQFDQFRRLLAEELEVPPSAETVALYERIHEGRLDSSITPGVRLREYLLMEEVGSGGYGTIYRALQPALDREVAIKVILPQYANDPEFMRRMEREARLVARLEHPHIVPLYDYWNDSGGIYLIMRLLRGGDLRLRMERGPLPPAEILRLMQQVAEALHAVHQQGIVHRDLKPSNILLDEQGNYFLTDFGIAKELAGEAHLTIPGTFIGSPAYISPEQLRNEAVTPQTDIYSLGIILYELLSGKHPYTTAKIASLIQQHLNDPLPSLHAQDPDLPAALDRVLGQATAKQPAARYKDVPSFLADFQQALSPTPRGTQPAPAAEPAEVRHSPLATRHLPLATPFVARERQLARLDYFLDRALSGSGQMVFVTGGAGRGKTSLLAQFTRQALAGHPRLLVACGSCNATAAGADPYLPFRELLDMLAGGVDAPLRSGSISADHAQRLREALPAAGKVIVEQGPELVDALIPGRDLLERGRIADPVGSPWLERLAGMIAGESAPSANGERKQLVAPFTAVLHTLSQKVPLILILDDLQWIDKASAGLLFHLSRNLAGYPILFACAYRREEVALGRDGERHPLEKVLNECKRTYGDIWINLAELQEAEEQHFVNTLLDQEPHRLSAGFREALYDHTGGHALFTVELLRAMQERGDLQRDADGRWFESDDLDWERLPLRVEGVIEERTGRLDEELRALLSTAAVEGELFTAEVLARVLGGDPRRIMNLLSRQLQAIHHLVREVDELRSGARYFTRYRFTHTLIQHYLYAQLSAGEQRLLHTQVAEALEDLLQDQWQPYAAALAWQFQQAGLPHKAVPYWLWLGDQARATYAHAEAESSYSQAIAALRAAGEKEQTGRTALKLAQVYTADFQTQKARETYAQAFTLWDPARDTGDERGALPGTRLRLALEKPSTLDPGLLRDEPSAFLVAQLFEGLVRVGKDQTVLPALARRWEVLDGGRRYRFHLRRDAAWNDGRPLTAADFVYAFTRNLHPDTRSPRAHLLYVLKNGRAFATGALLDAGELGISADDDYTLDLELERPVAYLPYLLAQPVAFPLPRRAIEAAAERWTDPQNIANNGPYQLAREEENGRLLLERNPHYPGRFRGNVESIDCAIISDYDQTLRAFERDELDIANLTNADPETITRVMAAYNDDLVIIPRWSTLHLSFRCDRPPFADRRVRQALACALDRQALAEEGFQGLRRAATGGFVPPGMPGYTENIALAYDPQKGRELLAHAGYPGGVGFPAVEWAASPGGERVISFLQRAWQENLGLDLQPVRMEWEVFMARLDGDPAQLTIIGWGADFPDPQNMLQASFHSQEGLNAIRWQNGRFDELTAAAESVLDHGKRMALYQEADRILVAKETAVLPLSYDQGRILVKPWVRLPPTPAIAMPLHLVTVARSP